MARRVYLDKDRVIELYEKYGTIQRTALSLDCSPTTLRKFLINNNIPIKEFKHADFNYNYIRTQ